MAENTPPTQQPQVVILKQEQSFTTRAIWTLLLYFAFYFPGLIANIVFWNEARQVKAREGTSPAGYGCLLVMLIIQIGFITMFCVTSILQATVQGLSGR